MFESAEVGHEVSKRAFRQREPDLRVGLLNAQFDLRTSGVPVILVLCGSDLQGVEDATDRLHEWLDARGLDTEVFLERTDEEHARPFAWRYWRTLPARGRVGVFVNAWVHETIAALLRERIDEAEFERRLRHVAGFERTLAADGAVVLKFWLHASKAVLRERAEEARERGRGWMLSDEDRRVLERYDDILPLAERFVRATDRPGAPWHIVASQDERHRDLTIFETLLAALDAVPARPDDAAAPSPAATRRPERSLLDRVDLDARVSKRDYEQRLEDGQARLWRLSVAARERGVSSVLAFEGWDAAGKGGSIRRLTRAMAARDYRVVPIAAPTDEERAHHYLWRFWRHLPRAGRMLIFDRSWYGRVLVERVEGFAREDAWRRAYTEIADFEQQLVEHGTVLEKFWLHIDPDEQLRRFEARERTPYKKYKITDDDYRNRERWDDYVAALDEMVTRTDAPGARWHLVAANDKRHARLVVLETVCDALERRLEG